MSLTWLNFASARQCLALKLDAKSSLPLPTRFIDCILAKFVSTSILKILPLNNPFNNVVHEPFTKSATVVARSLNGFPHQELRQHTSSSRNSVASKVFSWSDLSESSSPANFQGYSVYGSHSLWNNCPTACTRHQNMCFRKVSGLAPGKPKRQRQVCITQFSWLSWNLFKKQHNQRIESNQI